MKVTLRIHSRLKVRLVGKVREATDRVLERAVPYVVDTLSRIADAELKSTAELYKAGVRDGISTKGRKLTIVLAGAAKDYEVGFAAHDMKPKLLKSSSAKHGANGKYIDIPFRHKMSAMPVEVKSAVQARVRRERNEARAENRQQQNPLRVTWSMGPGAVNQQQRFDKRGKTSQVNVQHTTSIHSDMIRTRVGGSGRYSTIRRISANSDPQSWWHPGFRGVKALKRVAPELRKTMRLMYKQELARSK